MQKFRALIIFGLMVLVAMAAQGQSDYQVYASRGEPTFSFLYPSDWSVEADSETTFFVDGGETTILIEIVEAAFDPFIIEALESEVEEDTGAEAILNYYFTQTGGPSPELTEYDFDEDGETDREIATLNEDLEDIHALYVTPEYFALVFVGGDDREDDAEAVETLLTSLTLGRITQAEAVNGAADDDDSDSDAPLEFSEGTAQLIVPWEDGDFIVYYPQNLIADGFDGTSFIQDENESFVMVITLDLAFGFDLFGGEGNPATIATPRELLEAVVGDVSLFELGNDSESTLEERSIGGKAAAIFTANDAESDFALIALEVEPGILGLSLVLTELDAYESQRSVVEAILSSVTIP